MKIRSVSQAKKVQEAMSDGGIVSGNMENEAIYTAWGHPLPMWGYVNVSIVEQGGGCRPEGFFVSG